MTTRAVLEITVIVVFAPAVVMAVAILVHAAHADFSARRDALDMAACRPILIRLLDDDTAITPAEQSLLSALRPRLLLDLLFELDRSVRIAELEPVRTMAIGLGVVETAERLVDSRRWWRRLRGVRLFMLLDERRDLRPALLIDTHTSVRAAAATWTVAGATPAEISAVVCLLDDCDALTRFTAADALIRIGHDAVPAIIGQLTAREPRHLVAALEVVAWINDPRFLDPALALCAHDDAHVRSLAHSVLGAIGGTRALDQLGMGLADTDERVRTAAAGTLGRLRHWPAAPIVAAALDDPSGTVRLAAGLALHDMGSPGLLLLRRAARPSSPSSALARQILSRRDLVDSDASTA